MMQRNARWVAICGCIAGLALPALQAQYPVQKSKSNQDAPPMRSVAVLEWTGDAAKPKASRLVPVSVYDGAELQDGGIYLARPAPLALGSETEYELKDDGKTVGFFDIDTAGQEQGSWVGFGAWKPLPKPKPVTHSTPAANKETWADDAQSDRPVLHRKHSTSSSDSGSDSSGSAGQGAPDPDRPTLHKKSGGDSGDDSASSSAPASDPDRPTLHKKTSDGDSSNSSTAAADPDRPVLKKKSAGRSPEDEAYVDSVKTLSDPDRPKLQRGKSTGGGFAVAPTLMGLPPDMHQVVAVSDARTRPEHLWTYSWANPDDEAKMKSALEDIARNALGLASPKPAPAPVPVRRTATTARRTTKPTPPPPTPKPLLDEQFRVFELAYGSGATMVLSAHTDGAGVQQKFVTIVAQPDLYGNVVVLVKNVTDAAHLDDTPRMRLVDAVDAMADNRGELLFELRGATQRQFALYRVLRGQADRIFATGPGNFATASTSSE
jgi:hypothetical protein